MGTVVKIDDKDYIVKTALAELIKSAAQEKDSEHNVYIEPIIDIPRGYDFIECEIKDYVNGCWDDACLVSVAPGANDSYPYHVFYKGKYQDFKFCRIKVGTDLRGYARSAFKSYRGNTNEQKF